MDPLHATIEEFAAEGYSHIEALPAVPRDPIAANRRASCLVRLSGFTGCSGRSLPVPPFSAAQSLLHVFGRYRA